MSRYTDSKWKQSRHLTFSVLETGDELKKRAYGPGQHDASKEAINAHHQEGTKKELSRPLRSAKKEAFYFWKQFKKGRLEDDETHYFIELIRR